MARGPDRQREEGAPTVLTRRSYLVVDLSGLFGLFRLSRLAPEGPGRRGDNETDQNTASRFTSVGSARQLSQAVHDGKARGLPRKKNCRALNLFKRGNQLQ